MMCTCATHISFINIGLCNFHASAPRGFLAIFYALPLQNPFWRTLPATFVGNGTESPPQGAEKAFFGKPLMKKSCAGSQLRCVSLSEYRTTEAMASTIEAIRIPLTGSFSHSRPTITVVVKIDSTAYKM